MATQKPDTEHAITETHERRAMVGAVEFREDDTGIGTISGYAAVTGKETVIAGWFGFREKIAPGAFKDALGRDDVRALFNHDPNLLLGRTASGTLRLKEDKKGLHYEADLPDTAAANDVRTLIKRGDVSGSSFGFKVEEDEWDDSEVKAGKLPLRTITKVELFDVSPVTYPAYPTTTVTARSIQERATAGYQARQRSITQRLRMRIAIEQAKAWGA